MSEPKAEVILSGDDISRAIKRISHEITEKNHNLEDLIIVGIHTRGIPISQRIVANIKEIKNLEVPIGELDVTFYRDDISQKGATLNASSTNVPADLEGKTVVLVDDVLYTGRSIRAGIDHLIDLGRPARIQLAVLLDRGHRELPIRPDYVGKNIPTSQTQRVQVLLQEIDGKDSAQLEEEA